jgi:hypothetical protein
MSIKITIEKTVTKQWTARENVITKETANGSMKKDSYGRDESPVMDKEYAVCEVTKTSADRVTLLEQVDDAFDLARVIKAINQLEG